MAVSSEQQKQFIETIGPIIQAEAKARGYKVCSAVIAQAAIESAYGTSKLASVWGNFFGLKCGSSWKGPSVNLATKEEYNSVLVSIKDNFRVFQTDGKADMVLGVKGYYDFISTKRYASLKDTDTPLSYLSEIKKSGYATSSNYVNTCMNVVLKHELTAYDVDVGKPITPELISRVIAGEYGNGKARETALTNEGYTYSEVRKKINELDKIGKEILPTIKSKAGEYWKCLLKLMDL
jgi:flagellum-specific peptidoglycan hydrolase FlgJ